MVDAVLNSNGNTFLARQSANQAEDIMSEGLIKTPFNIEQILRACPVLLEAWVSEPFYFDFDEDGRVIVVYPDIP